MFITATIALALGSIPEHMVKAGARDTPVASPRYAQKSKLREGIAGIVRSPTGRPVPGLVVFAAPLNARSPLGLPDIAITTDRNGRFEWPLGSGVYILKFLQNGREMARVRAKVRSGRVTTINVTAPQR
jgi:Carboxypeptidase regulatory-like domain